MKRVKIAGICILVYAVWTWANASPPYLSVSDVIPFSAAGHSSRYNWICILLVVVAVQGIRQFLSQRGRERGEE